MNYTLRPYQEECKKVGLAVLRDSKGRKEVAILPTAWGKAVVIAFMAKELTDGRVLVLQPNIDLLNQGIEEIINFEVPMSEDFGENEVPAQLLIRWLVI